MNIQITRAKSHKLMFIGLGIVSVSIILLFCLVFFRLCVEPKHQFVPLEISNFSGTTISASVQIQYEDGRVKDFNYRNINPGVRHGSGYGIWNNDMVSIVIIDDVGNILFDETFTAEELWEINGEINIY